MANRGGIVLNVYSAGQAIISGQHRLSWGVFGARFANPEVFPHHY
jgi:hypothetical protein